MYGKIFESIFDSTLAAEGGWMPTYIFMSMVVLADKEGIVDVAPKALYRRLGFSDYDSKIAYADFTAALDYLQQEDLSSRSPKQNGKRIIPLSELADQEGNRGFVIVNYAYYRDRGSRDDRARQSTERTRRFREREKDNKNNDETQGDASKRMGRYTDTDTDTDTDIDKSTTAPAVPKESPEFLEFKMLYPVRSGGQPWTKALKAINARLREGEQWGTILTGVRRYAAFCDVTNKTGTEYVKQAATFCGPEKHFLESWEPPPTPSELRQGQNIDAANDWLEASSG